LYDVTSGYVSPLAVEVHGGTPRRLVPVAEVRPVLRKVVPLGPEVIVDDVEEDREPGRVARVHQTAQSARAPVGGLWRVEVAAVVAPITRARKLGDGHELDGGDARVDKRGKL